MISIVVKHDRLEFSNAALKDYAVEALSHSDEIKIEHATLLFQYGNKQKFAYFIFPENIAVAMRILKEGHAGYLKRIESLMEENRKSNLKLKPKEMQLGERPDRVMTVEEALKYRTLQLRSARNAVAHPFQVFKDLFKK